MNKKWYAVVLIGLILAIVVTACNHIPSAEKCTEPNPPTSEMELLE